MEQPEQDSVEQEVQTPEADEVELNEDSEQATPEDDEIEDEIEGVKVRGKKDQIERLKNERLMHADYTRKTQDVAVDRRQLAADRQQQEQIEQFKQQNFQMASHLQNIDQRLAQFNGIDWSSLETQQAIALDGQRRQLQSEREQLRSALAQRHGQFTQWQQNESAKKLSEGTRVLQREIPGWGPELAGELSKFALARGYSEQFLENLSEPRLIVDLYEHYKQSKTREAATKKPVVTQDKPVTRVEASKGRASVDPEKMSTDEWLRWRNKTKRVA